MTKLSKQSQAESVLRRLERLPADERVRQVEIYLAVEGPHTIMRKVLQPFHFKAKARLMKLEMGPAKRRKR